MESYVVKLPVTEEGKFRNVGDPACDREIGSTGVRGGFQQRFTTECLVVGE
jgi:hypothetical protein